MKPLKNGLGTGLILQLALGPVFFYILSLSLDKSFLNALSGVAAVTIIDLLFISLSIFGTTKILDNQKVKTFFAILSSFVLIFFGYFIMEPSNQNIELGSSVASSMKGDLARSFVSTFLLTILNPLTIIFFTGLFTAKAIEKNYSKNELYLFGIGTALATLFFMGSSVIIFTLLKSQIPLLFINISKRIVAAIIIGYGLIRLVDLTKKKLLEYK